MKYKRNRISSDFAARSLRAASKKPTLRCLCVTFTHTSPAGRPLSPERPRRSWRGWRRSRSHTAVRWPSRKPPSPPPGRCAGRWWTRRSPEWSDHWPGTRGRPEGDEGRRSGDTDDNLFIPPKHRQELFCSAVQMKQWFAKKEQVPLCDLITTTDRNENIGAAHFSSGVIVCHQIGHGVQPLHFSE